jgi:hypothetical protein
MNTRYRIQTGAASTREYADTLERHVTEEQHSVYNKDLNRYHSTVTRTVGERLVSPSRAAPPTNLAALRAHAEAVKGKLAAAAAPKKQRKAVRTVAAPETVHFVVAAAPPATVAVAAGTAAVAAKESPVRRGLPGQHARFSNVTVVVDEKCKGSTVVKHAVCTAARRLRKKNTAKRQQAFDMLKSQRQLAAVSELDDDAVGDSTTATKHSAAATKHSVDVEKGGAVTAVDSVKTHNDITDVYMFKSPWLFTQGLSLILLLINIYTALLLANYAIVVSTCAILSS